MAAVVIWEARGVSAYCHILAPCSLHQMIGWGAAALLAWQSMWWENLYVRPLHVGQLVVML